MSKLRIALITFIFVLVTLVIPLVLLLAFVDANNLSVYIVVFGVMFFGSIGFLLAMLFKTKSDIKEQIEEIKVQNAAIAFRLAEMKKQAKTQEQNNQTKVDETEKKENFDDFQ
ncbi:MAG: hypothetical protein IKC01_06885 [Clostridia bacterium]|nr:hypothetical protein [Clostridia bacterium]